MGQNLSFFFKGLAKLHATFIALKLLKPNTFKDVVLPFIDKIDIDAGMSHESRLALRESIKADVKNLPEFSLVRYRLVNLINRCVRKQQHLAYPKDSPFVTAVHNDFWVNNILIKYDDAQNTPVAIKIIDFQLISCDSVVHDVLFFIMTSIKDGCFETMIDMWLTFYHSKLLKHLQALNCPCEAYSYER